MDGQAIMTISAAVVALTQLLKWGGLPDRFAPLSVLALACGGVALWGYSQGTFVRTDTFAYASAWIAVATSAAGVYGFSRASGDAMTRLTTPHRKWAIPED